MSNNDFIGKLVDDAFTSIPWPKAGFENDFILLSEFSELEGPKPLLTIPPHQTSTFDLNAFAVRIMSVDCVSIVQMSEMSKFNIASDTQVVLTELNEGAVAYVHHFVLYDIRARGFVRPFCLAYITRNYTQLMSTFKEIFKYFTQASLLLHFGNVLFFLNDLWTRLCHVKKLKDILENNSAEMYFGTEVLLEPHKKGIDKVHLDEMEDQLIMLINVFLEYADRDDFSEHKTIFEAQYLEVTEKVKNSSQHNFIVSTFELSQIPESSEPSILLHEKPVYLIPGDLMSTISGKKYHNTLRTLNELCDFTFNIALAILKQYLESSSKLLLPSATDDEECVQITFCSVNYMLNACIATCRTTSSNPVYEFDLKHFISFFGFCEKDEVDSPMYRYNSFESGLSSSFLSQMKNTAISSGISTDSSNKEFFTIISQDSKDSYCVLDSPASSSISSGSYKDALNTLPNENSADDSLKKEMVATKKQPPLSPLNNFRTEKVSCLSIRNRYSFLEHVVYSLITGRTVIIHGEDHHQNNVKKLTKVLSVFLPHTQYKAKKIIPWSTSPFLIHQLSDISLIGLLKGKNMLSTSITSYISLLDYEKQTLQAPQYEGKYLSNMFDLSKQFISENTYRAYIKQIFLEMCSTAYVHFATRYEHRKGMTTSNKHWANDLPFRLHYNDLNIIRSISTMFTDCLIGIHDNSLYSECNGDTSSKLVSLNVEKCSLFINKYSKKKYAM